MDVLDYPRYFVVLNRGREPLDSMQSNFVRLVELISQPFEEPFYIEGEEQFLIEKLNNDFKNGSLSKDDLKAMCKYINNLMYGDLYDIEESLNFDKILKIVNSQFYI